MSNLYMFWLFCTLISLTLTAIGTPVALKFVRIWRLLRSTQATPIEKIKTGLVKISGQVIKTQDLLISPYNRIPCVYYKLLVEQWTNSASERHWKDVINEEKSLPILIRDATGEIVVELNNAQLLFKQNTRFVAGGFGFDPVPQRFNDFATKERGLALNGFLLEKTWRCTEIVLLPGMPVFVIGQAVKNLIQGARFEPYNGVFLVSNETVSSMKNRFALRGLLSGIFALLAGWFAGYACWQLFL